MRSASIAEWIVSRFTSSARAVSFVGDLEESRPQKGHLWFWASLAGFLFLLCWRRFAALIAAFYLGSRVFAVLQFIALRTKSQHRPQDSWVSLFLAISAVGAFLWMTSIYAATRYGLRDRATQLSFLWSGLATAVLVSWWHPAILLFSITLGGVHVFFSMTRPKDRSWLLVLMATVGSGLASYLLVLLCFITLMSVQNLRDIRAVQNHPSILGIGYLLTFIATWTMTSVFSRMHRWVLRSERPDAAGESDFA